MSACRSDDFACIVRQCSGGAGSGQSLFNYWATHNCPNAYSQFINTDTRGAFVYNPAAQNSAQNYVVSLFQNYLRTNEITDNITSPQYSPFQNNLLSLCTDPALPGICGRFLQSYCDQFTRDQIINSPVLTSFCGCYTNPDPEFIQFATGTTGCETGDPSCVVGCDPADPNCNPLPACDPICRLASTSKRAVDETGVILDCPQHICAIDNIQLNVANSVVPGGVTFNNICLGCDGGPNNPGCLCIIGSPNISGTLADIGIGVNVNQICGANSTCIVQDSQGNTIDSGPCSFDAEALASTTVSTFPSWSILAIILLTIFIIFIIIIAVRSSRIKL